MSDRRKLGRQSLGHHWAGLAGNQQGAVWIMAAAFGFAINAALAKNLTIGGMHPFQVALARAFFAFVALTPFLLRGGLKAFHTRHPWVHFTRALAGSGAMLLGFFAIANLPLAEVTALGFTTPLFTVILAVLLLSERVRWRRWTATAVGFAGMLVMVRPGMATLGLGSAAAIGGAFLVAVAATMVKRFPKGESQAVMLFYFCVTSLVLALPLAIGVWREPTLTEWLALAGVGVLGVGAQAMFISAYRHGDASFVAPFDYTRLIFAGVIGYLAFQEVPDLWTLVGAAIIVASTLYIARREARVRAG